MGTFAVGEVVLVFFPFSDLSDSKLRPALVLAESSRKDWILCQITSNPYGDPHSIPISENDFQSGNLHRNSFVRPRKLFTASESVISRKMGQLKWDKTAEILDSLQELFTIQHENNDL